MRWIYEQIEKLERIEKAAENVPFFLSKAAIVHQNDLLSLNRDQMLSGRDAGGDLFTPDYLSDPYFDSPEATITAEGYANMKYFLEPSHKARLHNPMIYPDKPKNTPNLIVTGPFQNKMFIEIGFETYKIGSKYPDSGDINDKYKGLVFGLAPRSNEYAWREFIRTYLINSMNSLIKGA